MTQQQDSEKDLTEHLLHLTFQDTVALVTFS